MTPGVEETLRTINWDDVKRKSPWHSAKLAYLLRIRGGLVQTPAQAKKPAKEIAELLASIQIVMDGLGQMSPQFAADVNLACCASLQEAENPPDRILLALQAMLSVLPGIMALQGRLQFLANQTARGQPPHLAVRAIINALGEVYIIGCREVPTYGLDWDSGETNSRFVIAATAILGELGLPTGNVRRLTKDFSSSITEEQKSALLAVGDLPFNKLFKIQLIEAWIDDDD